MVFLLRFRVLLFVGLFGWIFYFYIIFLLLDWMVMKMGIQYIIFSKRIGIEKNE